MDGFRDCFSGVEDPRTGNARRHDLQELLLIALCTVLCGGESFSPLPGLWFATNAIVSSSAWPTTRLATFQLRHPKLPGAKRGVSVQNGRRDFCIGSRAILGGSSSRASFGEA